MPRKKDSVSSKQLAANRANALHLSKLSVTNYQTNPFCRSNPNKKNHLPLPRRSRYPPPPDEAAPFSQRCAPILVCRLGP